jgi:hypothetical protein
MPRSSRRWSFYLLGLVVMMALVLSCRGEERFALLVISGPEDLESFAIAKEDGEVLWSIAASEPRTLSRIEYGSVPTGFHQLVPAGNEPPRSLIVGEWLECETVTRDGVFLHQGLATGPETFEPVTSTMSLVGSDARSPD